MCGIIVWIKKNGSIDQKIFFESVKTIIHRGPDSQKIYLLNTKSGESKNNYLKEFEFDNGEFNIAFGSTRFGTYDSSSRKSDMPMISYDGNNVLSFNGDVYNYKDLKKEMRLDGHSFDTDVDTEVLLKGLINYGTSFLKRVNSDYSFVFYDKNKNQIVFSRDTFGAIPLFYFDGKEDIIISSELGPIKSILKSKHEFKFNPNFYSYFLATNEWPYDSRSNLLAYENINSVEPGSINTLNVHDFKIKKLNDFNIKNIIRSSKKINIDELEDLLIKSIKYRLQTDKNLGLFLSGGLDSSLIVSLYQKFLKKDFPNLEIFTSENFHKDQEFVKLLSNELNFEFTEIKIGYDQNIFEAIDDITLKTSLPVSTYGNSIGQYIMFKKMKELNKGIIITGHGGDQIFSGLFSHANASVEYLKKLNLTQSFYHGFLSKSFDVGTHRLILKNYLNQIAQLFSEKLVVKEISKLYSDNSKTLRTVKNQQLYDILSGNFATSNNLINFISMSNSVAVRSPLIDRNFLGFINNKLEDKFKFGFDRYALRNILKKYESTVYKRKQKQGLRWRGMNMLPLHKDRILDNIKTSSIYRKSNAVNSHVKAFENNNSYANDMILKYYSISRFEKLSL